MDASVTVKDGTVKAGMEISENSMLNKGAREKLQVHAIDIK